MIRKILKNIYENCKFVQCHHCSYISKIASEVQVPQLRLCQGPQNLYSPRNIVAIQDELKNRVSYLSFIQDPNSPPEKVENTITNIQEQHFVSVVLVKVKETRQLLF
jgi:hypothetical protein